VLVHLLRTLRVTILQEETKQSDSPRAFVNTLGNEYGLKMVKEGLILFTGIIYYFKATNKCVCYWLSKGKTLLFDVAE